MADADPVCGCPPAAFPAAAGNPPGQDAIAARIGDFATLRADLLRPRDGETALAGWTPRADGDLALQLVDWWAYIGDVLTFYSERIANESYLRTARLPENVAHLAQTLGYRPRPALGAHATLAALLASGARAPVTVPQGTRIQNKPGPGSEPQVFEVSADTAVAAPDTIGAAIVPANAPLLGQDGLTIWLAGKPSGINPGDRLLVTSSAALAGGAIAVQAWIVVSSLTSTNDPLGRDVTALAFTIAAGSLGADLAAGDVALLRARQSSPLWSCYVAEGQDVITDASLTLAGVARGLGAGALMLIEVTAPAVEGPPIIVLPWALSPGEIPPGAMRYRFAGETDAAASRTDRFDAGRRVGPTAFGTQAVTVASYAETMLDAAATTGQQPPPKMLAATIGFAALSPAAAPDASLVTIRWDWTRVGTPVPVLTAADYTAASTARIARAPAARTAFPAADCPVVVADATRRFASASFVAGTADAATLTGLTQPVTSPLTLYFDALPVSRGKSVLLEILGSGDTRIAGQQFTLAKAPVTYVSDPASVSGDQFSSSVTVRVDGVAWQEARSFFGAGPTDTIFVLSEDAGGSTHVMFGDGTNGARLPTGTGNVTASYRYGAGAAAPPPDTLTTVLTPVPGLKGVVNPFAPTGGADADPPARIRQLAVASVLTLGRVVSLDDFAATAMTAGGVTQATAAFSIDPVTQRPAIVVRVAGDAGAVALARAALVGAGADPARFTVVPANPVEVRVTIGYLSDPRIADADVAARLLAGLSDPDAGLLGANVLGIGQPIYDSQIAAACARVAGVVAVTSVRFAVIDAATPSSGPRHDPGEGNYFVLPADTEHVVLIGQAGSAA